VKRVRVALAGLALVVLAGIARAGDAPGDSLLHAYVRSMSDSTDRWFGLSAAPTDTAGLDSSLAAGLASGRGLAGFRQRRGVRFSWSPALGFNRADGAQLGALVGLRTPLPGEVSARAQYTTGMRDAIGDGAWRGSFRVSPLRSRLALRLAAGRWTEAFDRDHWQPFYSSVRAVAFGNDRNQYLRRDGFAASARLGSDRGYLQLGWRSQRESAMRYTTRWTVFSGGPTLAFVDPARRGRASEVGLEGDATIPGTRFRVNAAYWNSDPRIGSDFLYRRARVTAGGDISLGRHLALVPQATYGLLRGDPLPQEAFFLGGGGSLHTLESAALESMGMAFARIDLVLADDLGPLLHLPLPLWLPLQAGVFAASGAVWDRAPLGRPVSTSAYDDARHNWIREVGGGLSWRPGIPDPQTALRFEYARPVGPAKVGGPVQGPAERSARFTISLQRTLNLLPARD